MDDGAQIKIAKALAHLEMDWLEIDTYDPQALAKIRDNAPM